VAFCPAPSSAASRTETVNIAPIGSNAQPVRVVPREVPLYLEPSIRAGRRGTLAQGAQTFIHQHLRASGCAGEWVLVGATAWACSMPGVFAPRDANDQSTSLADAPTTYALIGERGALGYRTVSLAEEELPEVELQPGFFVAIVEERSLNGERYVRTTHDVWMAKRDIIPIVASSFEGVELEPFDGEIMPFGWVYVGRAAPRRTIHGATVPSIKLRRLARVRVLETRHDAQHNWYRIAEGWLSDKELRVPRVSPMPEGVAINERWLDIDRLSQTLVAYVGTRPVFATLVSTGRGPARSPTATPSGLFRIWVKLISADMDNLDEQNAASDTVDVASPYSVEAVPFVMFFSGGYGLHATYWHDGFGTPRSHGCVNLSLSDAARLFEFSSPRLAPGWQAAHPNDYDQGTLVRVR
jgi:hypothetical protein